MNIKNPTWIISCSNVHHDNAGHQHQAHALCKHTGGWILAKDKLGPSFSCYHRLLFYAFVGPLGKASNNVAHWVTAFIPYQRPKNAGRPN